VVSHGAFLGYIAGISVDAYYNSEELQDKKFTWIFRILSDGSADNCCLLIQQISNKKEVWNDR